MSRVKGKDTLPELIVRKKIFGLGYRYRLHLKTIPGRPDIAFPSRKKLIFIHGCFWHQHDGCRRSKMPSSKIDFWKKKLEGNKLRDRRIFEDLKKLGWDILVLWECDIRNEEVWLKKISDFLGPKRSDSKHNNCYVN